MKTIRGRENAKPLLNQYLKFLDAEIEAKVIG